MTNLTSVTVTSGVPTSGTGTVSTIDNLIGAAGTGSASVLTVQGNASGTAVPVSVAVVPSHAVTNAGTFAVQNSTATPTGTNEIGKISTEPRLINAVTSTLTRPTNTTAYSALDSISDNGTAGSVTALSATVSDLNDAPICLTEVMLDTTDTGLAAGIYIRAYLYNADPTASTGVVGGDNAAFSNKRNGFVGSMSGVFRAFSDGGKARLVPDEGSYIIANPLSSGETLYIQYQTLTAFTPSANSTTIGARIKGFQGRV